MEDRICVFRCVFFRSATPAHAFTQARACPIDLQNDLGLDSLGLATVVTDLQASLDFDLQYFAENIGEIRLVRDLVRVVEEALLKN